jgi:hypothetical protein
LQSGPLTLVNSGRAASSGDFPEIQLPEMLDLRVPESTVQSIVYIGQSEKGKFRHAGTGVLVAHHYSNIGKGEKVYFLVTVDHVARGVGGSVAIRLNKATGESAQVLPPKGMQWWHHPTDKTVDLAVIPWVVNPQMYNYKLFRSEGILTQEKVKQTSIGIGDEVYAVGLFTLAKGVNRITPIVRVGHIAMMAGERLKTTHYGDALMHLVEARSLHGLSGSPVFARDTFAYQFPQGDQPPRYGRIAGELYLLGLIHGHWIAEDRDIGADVHSGVSMVVPAWQILEIIEQPALVADITKRLNDSEQVEPIESSVDSEIIESSDEPETRDITIPPTSRKKFIGVLEKATQRQKRGKP